MTMDTNFLVGNIPSTIMEQDLKAPPDTTGAYYRIVLVEPAEAPDDLGGKNWYRYVIDQGENRIYGYRRGSRQEITKSIEELVMRVNERRIGSKGRASPYTYPKGKPAKHT